MSDPQTTAANDDGEPEAGDDTVQAWRSRRAIVATERDCEWFDGGCVLCGNCECGRIGETRRAASHVH